MSVGPYICLLVASSLLHLCLVSSRCGILSSHSFSFFSLFVILKSLIVLVTSLFLCAQFNWSSVQKVSKDVKTDLLTIHTVKKEAWVMDNRSSYVANIATGLLKSTFFTVLLAHKNVSNRGIAKLRPILRMLTALGILK